MNKQKFLLGTSSAAHQVEGNNIHSDLWIMENLPHSMFKEPSLDAVDHYNRYQEDINLMKNAGLNAYRFSIEWARIEPEQGEFDKREIEHYRQVIQYCKSLDIEPIITLHHFTSPAWLIKQGGWEAESTIDAFASYTRYVIENLGKEINYVCTINEANMGLQIAKVAQRMQKKSNLQVGINLNFNEKMKNYMTEVSEAFQLDPRKIHSFLSMRSKNSDELVVKTHVKAREVIRELCPHIKVGLTLSLHDIQANEGGEAYASDDWNEEFLHYLPVLKNDDFLGLQNYTRKIVDQDGEVELDQHAIQTKMGYEFYPQALEHVIRKVHEDLQIPIMVTENGISTDDDQQRVAFIDGAINGIRNCINDGIDIIGYCLWSLLDNFEWQLGYVQTFGLIAVDRKTQTRYPKPSLTHLGSKKDLF